MWRSGSSDLTWTGRVMAIMRGEIAKDDLDDLDGPDDVFSATENSNSG